MNSMRNSSVTAISERRERRVERAVAARRRLDRGRERRSGGGRAWVNGSELGGVDPRFAHLAQSFD
jgi:hypothetical protein